MNPGIGAGAFFKAQGPTLDGKELNLEFAIRIPKDPPVPDDLKATDTAWTDWQKTRDPIGQTEARTGERYQVRYRVAPVPSTT